MNLSNVMKESTEIKNWFGHMQAEAVPEHSLSVSGKCVAGYGDNRYPTADFSNAVENLISDIGKAISSEMRSNLPVAND